MTWLRLETRFEQTLAARRHEHHCDYRIVRPDGEVRWIESRSVISYDGEGAGPRLVGANIDVTDRKNAERALDERNMQLSLAGKAAGVGTFISDMEAGVAQVTEGYVALYGLPEGATETTRGEWRARVHPEDIARIEEARGRFTAKGKANSAMSIALFARGVLCGGSSCAASYRTATMADRSG